MNEFWADVSIHLVPTESELPMHVSSTDQANPDFDEMLRFYQQPEWEQKLRSFANIDDDASTVVAKTLTAIARMSKR